MTSISRLGIGFLLLTAAAGYIVGCQRQQPSTASTPNAQTSAQVPQTPKVVGPPSVPDGFVLRPTFDTTLGTITAGTAFPVKLPGHNRPVILTAIHLLGTAGGLPRDVPAAEVPQVMRGLTLKDCFNASLNIAKPGAPIVIADAGLNLQLSKAGDILAFWGQEGSSLQPASLATNTPVAGERVWLAALVLAGAPPTQRLHPATVTGMMQDGNLAYQFDNSMLSIQATSGAPVLNAAGEVVAINLGGSKQGDVMYGGGNPVGRFAPYLRAALKQ